MCNRSLLGDLSKKNFLYLHLLSDAGINLKIFAGITDLQIK